MAQDMKRPSAKTKHGSDRGVRGKEARKRKLSVRAKFCVTCGQIRQDGPRHRFDFPNHVLRPLTIEEKNQFLHEEEQAGPYRLDFGKHKKKSLAWLQKNVPSYIAWLVRERVYDQRPQLKEALLSEGLFPVSLLNLEDEKERCKKALQIIESWPASQSDQADGEQILPVDASAAEISPLVPVSTALKAGKQTDKKKRHLKYTHPEQQTAAYAAKKRHALVERKHRGQELHRLSAFEFTKVMREYGLFEDLTGQPCQKPGCSDVNRGFGANNGSVLGGLGASAAGRVPGSDITLRDCCYRCLKCRERVSVTEGNVYFPPTARGGYGPTLPVLL